MNRAHPGDRIIHVGHAINPRVHVLSVEVRESKHSRKFLMEGSPVSNLVAVHRDFCHAHASKHSCLYPRANGKWAFKLEFGSIERLPTIEERQHLASRSIDVQARRDVCLRKEFFNIDACLHRNEEPQGREYTPLRRTAVCTRKGLVVACYDSLGEIAHCLEICWAGYSIAARSASRVRTIEPMAMMPPLIRRPIKMRR